MTASVPLTPTDRFAWIIRGLHAAVAARIRFPPVTAAIIVHICARLRRIAAEFQALADKIRAGTYVGRSTGQRCAARRTSRSERPSPRRMHYELGLPPWRSAWLHRVAPGDAGVWASALRALLSEPEMVALLSATPRVGRILRPLCFMLGLEARLLRPSLPTAPITPDTTDDKAHGSHQPPEPMTRPPPPAPPARGGEKKRKAGATDFSVPLRNRKTGKAGGAASALTDTELLRAFFSTA